MSRLRSSYLFCWWRHAHLNNDNGSCDVLLLHLLTVHLYRFYAHLRLLCKWTNTRNMPWKKVKVETCLIQISQKAVPQSKVILTIFFENLPGKKTNIWSVGSSLWATNTVRSVRLGRPSLGLSPNWPLKSSSVWSNSSCVTRYPLSWHSWVCKEDGRQYTEQMIPIASLPEKYTFK